MDLADRLWRLQNLYVIRDKDRNLRKLKFNTSQNRIIAAIKDELSSGAPIRHMDLKTRQIGATTFWAIFYLDDTIFNRNTISFIVAQKHETLELIWETVRLAYNSMPAELRPVANQDTAKTLSFEDIHSTIKVSLKVLSTTLHNLHVSEYALCDPEEIEQTLAAAPPKANITFETVSNGMNHAYDKWFDRNDGWTRLFHPWFLQEEYKLAACRVLDRTTEEKQFTAFVNQKYSLFITDEQLQFRRQKRRELRNLYQALFAEDENKCFLASGLAYFNNAKISVLLQEAEQQLELEPPIRKTDDLVVFESPQHRHIYVAGADVAGGRDNVGTDPDWSVLAILCTTCRKTAARYRARVNHDVFYRTCYNLGMAYNRALLAIERNNHGHAILLGLREMNYPNLYYQKPVQKVIGFPIKPDLKYGWDTDSTTKPIMLDHLRQALEGDSTEDETHFQPDLLWLDTEFLKETFSIREEGGKISAIVGKHDDMVIAYAIAYQMYLRSQRADFRHIVGGIIKGSKLESA